MGPKRGRRSFDAPFKLEAVRRWQERQRLGVSLSTVARDLEVRPDPLRAWQRQAAARAGRAPHDAFPGEGRLPELNPGFRGHTHG
jgi:transposase-like protein